MSSNPNTYDLVQFSSKTHPGRHPARLKLIARLFGVKAPPLENTSILEIGCSTGWSLFPIALEYPNARILGIDYSEEQIKSARQIAAELGLRNIEFLAQSIMDFDAGATRYDYILCHGVYSWVGTDVQNQILKVAGSALSDQGLACISFNTYPGWHQRRVVRDLLAFKDSSVRDPHVRIKQARATLDCMSRALGYDRFYALGMQPEFDRIRRESDSYLFHEFLESENNPEYFHQFIAKSAESGLQYVGDARFSKILHRRLDDADIPRDALPLFEAMSNSIIDREQYMDFLLNTVFRETLLCRADLPVAREVDEEVLRTLSYAACLRPVDPDENELGSGTQEYTDLKGGTFYVEDFAQKVVMKSLAAKWPQHCSHHELLDSIMTALPETRTNDSLRSGVAGGLNDFLLFLFGRDLLEVYESPPTFATEPGTHPSVSPFARVQLRFGRRATNLKNETVELGDLERALARHMDGYKSRDDLFYELQKLVRSGELVIHEDGEPVTDPAQHMESLRIIFEDALKMLAGAALLKPENSLPENDLPKGPQASPMRNVFHRITNALTSGKKESNKG